MDQIQLHSCPCYNVPDSIFESLMIMSGNCCFQIDGNHLYEALNSFKKQLARIHAGFIDPNWDQLQMSYKKWRTSDPGLGVKIGGWSSSNFACFGTGKSTGVKWQNISTSQFNRRHWTLRDICSLLRTIWNMTAAKRSIERPNSSHPYSSRLTPRLISTNFQD